eukprot:TRINITY_DN41818_c0_g1_i1.p1 TRINITY_DN41818_c0_g1~~TRINITY_DN41818_c0_g1_i1.p1  ORF type:complete len:443 (-),score=69.79 TRINITY_DN41818_c0_g1_i1:230-1498(-)
MACTVASAVHALELSVHFTSFKALWDERTSNPDGLASNDFCVGGCTLFLKFEESKPGHVGLKLWRSTRRDNYVPLEVTSFVVVWNGQKSEFARVRHYPPVWAPEAEWPPSSGFLSSNHWGWPTWQKTDKLLEQLAQDDGAVSLQVSIKARVAHSCPHFQTCLQVPHDVLGDVLSGPSLVTLKGEDDYEVLLPSGLVSHHSAVLAAALGSDMLEGQRKAVQMPDVSQQALKDLRDCFLTSGLPSHILTGWERLLDVLVVAKKYEIVPLVNALTFLLSSGMAPTNVAVMLLKADKYGLAGLLRAALHFAVGSDAGHKATVEADEYDVFSAELLRLFAAYEKVRKTGDGVLQTPPPHLQWGEVPHEFNVDTDWTTLDKYSLRRACFERGLGTAGTAAEMVARLPAPGPAQKDDAAEPSGKRQRVE